MIIHVFGTSLAGVESGKGSLHVPRAPSPDATLILYSFYVIEMTIILGIIVLGKGSLLLHVGHSLTLQKLSTLDVQE